MNQIISVAEPNYLGLSIAAFFGTTVESTETWLITGITGFRG